MRRAILPLIAALALLAAAQSPAAPAPTTMDAIPRLYKNCTNLNRTYPHGVGRANARDRTSGEPVTNFRRNTRIYNLAMRWNRRLDGDRDGVACEKR